MRKILFFSLLFLCYPAFSQMVDVMGTLGIQGALTTGETQSVARGLSVMKQNQVLQDLTQTAMEVKTQFMGNYTSVNKSSVFKPFCKLEVIS